MSRSLQSHRVEARPRFDARSNGALGFPVVSRGWGSARCHDGVQQTRQRHVCWLRLVVIGLAIAARTAGAQEELKLRLQWTAPTTCPDAATVKDKVRALLPSGTRSQLRINANGHVTREAGQYRLRLTLRSGPFASEQEFSGESCDDVVGAAAITIALLLQSRDPDDQDDQDEPDRQREEVGRDAPLTGPTTTTVNNQRDAGQSSSGPRETKPRKTEDAGGASRSKSKPQTEDPAARRIPKVVLALPMFSADFGLFPRASWGVGGGAGIEVRHFQALLAAWWTVNPGGMVSEDFPDTSAKLWHGRVGARLCQWQGPARFNVGPCLDVMMEHLVARGEGSDIAAQSRRATWMSLGATASARFLARRGVAALTTLGLHLQTSRPELFIEGQGALGQIGLTNLTGGLGVEWIF